MEEDINGETGRQIWFRRFLDMQKPYHFIRGKWNLDGRKASIIGSDTQKEVGIFPPEPPFLGSRNSHEIPHTQIYYSQSF